MNNVEVITTITYIFFICLILALFVERIMEVVVAVYNYLEFKLHWYNIWDRKAKKYQARYDRLYGFQAEGKDKKKKIFDWLLWKAITEPAYVGGKPIISSNLLRLNYIRIGTRTLAFIFSLILVSSQGVDLIEIIEELLPVTQKLKIVIQNYTLRITLTAIAISLGSEPLHHLITRLEKFAEKKAESS